MGLNVVLKVLECPEYPRVPPISPVSPWKCYMNSLVLGSPICKVQTDSQAQTGAQEARQERELKPFSSRNVSLAIPALWLEMDSSFLKTQVLHFKREPG